MSRPSLSWPVAIIAGFAVLLGLMLLGSIGSAAPAQQPPCAPGSTYPACIATKTAVAGATRTQAALNLTDTALALPCGKGSPAYPLCATQTAAAKTASAEPPQEPGNPSDPGNPQPSATPTPTSTATFTPTATRTTGTASTAGTASPTATTARASSPTAGASQPTATPTSRLPAGVETIACIPGETVDLRGEASPNTALLLFFDGRAVGGGYTLSDGRYRLRLQVGTERPGVYLVEVQERDSRLVVQQIGCDVPALTPTPTSELVP